MNQLNFQLFYLLFIESQIIIVNSGNDGSNFKII
jgi:hypothetical protein